MSKFRYALLVFLIVPLLGVSISGPGRSSPGGETIYDRGDNALWMRRHWLHEATTPEEIAALAENLKARGIRRIYPFLGPMDKDRAGQAGQAGAPPMVSCATRRSACARSSPVSTA